MNVLERTEVSSLTRRTCSDSVRVVKAIVLLLFSIVAACGRTGFDPAPGPGSSAAPDAASLDHLTCGTPAQFSVGATTSHVRAATTPRGYNVFTVDDTGNASGFTYEFQAGTLVQKAGDVPLMTGATGPIGSVPLGDQSLLAVPYGRPTATGTALLPLDAQLAARAQPAKQDGWFGSFSSLAPAASGNVVFLGQLASGEVDAKLVSPLGADEGAAHPVINAAEGVGMPTLVPAGPGWLVTWEADAPSPNEVRAEILDGQFAVTTPATTMSFDMQFDSEIPRVAYSAASDSYVFAWIQKSATGDQVWISLRDHTLAETQHRMLASGYAPAVVAGDADFLVVWENGPQLSGARVTADGKVTLVSILGSGGKFAAWDLVVHNGQPAIAWVESGGTGPNLRLDPLCN